jgi:hypothetical protein
MGASEPTPRQPQRSGRPATETAIVESLLGGSFHTASDWYCCGSCCYQHLYQLLNCIHGGNDRRRQQILARTRPAWRPVLFCPMTCMPLPQLHGSTMQWTPLTHEYALMVRRKIQRRLKCMGTPWERGTFFACPIFHAYSIEIELKRWTQMLPCDVR